MLPIQIRYAPRYLLALALTGLLVSGAQAGMNDWSEEKVNEMIAKHAKDVHSLTLRAFSGGTNLLLGGRFGKDKGKENLEIAFHGKVDAAGIQGGSAVLVHRGPGQSQAKFPTLRGSVMFHLQRPMPAKPGAATDLFDELMGEGARGGVYGGRPFTRGEEGNWVLYGEFKQPGDGGFQLKAITSIGPDEDDPSLLVITMLSEVETGSNK